MIDNLNLKDKRILHELDRDARQSNAKIGKKIKLSKDAVGYRIKQLEKRGIIKGYRTVVDMSKLGYITYRVLFNLVNVNEKILNELVDSLKQENEVWGGGILEGEWDFSFLYFAKNNIQFYHFLERFMGKFRYIIKNELISPIIKYHELGKNYILDEKDLAKEKITFNDKTVDVDKIDFRILKALSKNARAKLIDMSDEFDLSSMLIHQRIKKLEEKKVILRYQAYIDVLLLGKDYYGVKMNLDNYSEKDKILEEVYALKEVSAVLYTLGGYDIEFDLEISGTKEYYKIINKLRNKFTTIKEVKYMGTVDYYLLNHFPEQ